MIKKSLRNTRRATLNFWNRLRIRSVSTRNPGRFVLVMVVVPNLVHTAIPAVRLILPYHPIILINNGLRPWERKWLEEQLPLVEIVDLKTTSFFGTQLMIGHGEVISEVMKSTYANVGFIDPDCYVFRPSLIEEISSAVEDGGVAALYWYRNKALSIDVPDTYFFSINGHSYRKLRREFGSELGVTLTLSDRLTRELESMWPGKSHFPHEWKAYYDTLHTTFLAAAAAGESIEYIASEFGDIFHVGGTSYHTGKTVEVDTTDTHKLNAYFFHLSLIERFSNEMLYREFSTLLKHYPNSRELLFRNPNFAQSKTSCETAMLVKKLESRGVI